MKRVGGKGKLVKGEAGDVYNSIHHFPFTIFPFPHFPLFFAVAIFFAAMSFAACNAGANLGGIPPQAQAAIDALTQDFDKGNYEKIYNEAAPEWREKSSLEQSNAFFNTLKTKLGPVKNRAFHTARDQQQNGGQLPGHSFVITYETSFERAEGMETLTLVERDGRWLLAGYFVNSDVLKP